MNKGNYKKIYIKFFNNLPNPPISGFNSRLLYVAISTYIKYVKEMLNFIFIHILKDYIKRILFKF